MINIFNFLNKRFSGLFLILFIFSSLLLSGYTTGKLGTIPPYLNILAPLEEEVAEEDTYEVFGFAPWWTMDELGNVDFSVLTTLAYFGVEINSSGDMVRDSGYQKFYSSEATNLFKKAHNSGTKVVLTLTQMNNYEIETFLENKSAQKKAINSSVKAVHERGIDGINVDFEYAGTANKHYRGKFTTFVRNLTAKMHHVNPQSYVSVSVYASSAKDRKLYDLKKLSSSTDGIFMMAYDFATQNSDQVIPTAPLYGHKEGKYWYDISTAVDDFLEVMPEEKLILGLPWYGYNYPVGQPEVKAARDYGYYAYAYNRWGYRYSYYVPRGGAHAQTYTDARKNTVETSGWDDAGKVGWEAYRDESGLWRMIFLEDARSLSIKYDFAKQKKLGGVGIWALGYDGEKKELWTLLQSKFGTKLVDNNLNRDRFFGIL